MPKCIYTACLEITCSRTATIAPTIVDLISLLIRRANASTGAAERRTAALGLALVILEHEEFPIVQILFGA